MWKNQASFSEAWDVEKMKEQRSRNGVGRVLRRIRGFGAHACRRHACGGSAPAEFRPGAGTCAPPGEYAVSLCMHGLNPEQIHFRIPTPQASNLRLAYTKPKRKSGQAALFLHMSTECSMCTGRQNTHHRKPYPFTLCICIGISIYIYINICIRFFILCRKETIGFISPYA